MTITLQESGWTFVFDTAHWTAVVRWDDDPTYTRAFQKLTGKARRSVTGCAHPGCRWPNGRSHQLVTESTRAVDFACIGPSDRPWLIEVKAIQGSNPVDGIPERAMTIAGKVRDSLVGLEWARASEGDVPAPELGRVRARVKRAGEVVVLVIFEDLRPAAPVQTIALQAELQRRLSWLRGTVIVADAAITIPGLSITRGS